MLNVNISYAKFKYKNILWLYSKIYIHIYHYNDQLVDLNKFQVCASRSRNSACLITRHQREHQRLNNPVEELGGSSWVSADVQQNENKQNSDKAKTQAGTEATTARLFIHIVFILSYITCLYYLYSIIYIYINIYYSAEHEQRR